VAGAGDLMSTSKATGGARAVMVLSLRQRRAGNARDDETGTVWKQDEACCGGSEMLRCRIKGRWLRGSSSSSSTCRWDKDLKVFWAPPIVERSEFHCVRMTESLRESSIKNISS